MRSFIQKNHLFLFFGGWLLLNLIQAGCTELFDDEAYYWIYSQYPAWGYFDHPPMIAWLIKAGYAIFPNELGVRFFVVLMNTGTLVLLYDLLEKKNARLFYAIAFSLALAQIGGIMAVPDLPLLFFTALFFWCYRRFTTKMNLVNSLVLGLVVALMMYSKYHGVLVVFFTLLSNPKLFLRYQTYLVTGFALLLFAPHLWWQYEHGFPSVQFHLFERHNTSYRISFTTDYLAGQLLLAGPIVGWMLLWAAWKYRTTNGTEKALRFTLIGVYVLFFISSLRGKTEANWTVPAFTGLIVLSHQYLTSRENWQRWLYRLLPITIVIVFAVRIYMMLDIPALSFLSKDEFHENKTATAAILQKAGDHPIAVLDSYQKPSKIWFYGKGPVFSLNSPWYRRNNFNYWPAEDSLLGKTVYFIGHDSPVFNDTIPFAKYKKDGGLLVSNYYSWSKIQLQNIRKESVDRETIQYTATINSPENYLPFMQQAGKDTASVLFVLYNNRGDVMQYLPTSIRVGSLKEAKQSVTLSAKHQLEPGTYNVRMGINSRLPGFPSLNSTGFKVVIE